MPKTEERVAGARGFCHCLTAGTGINNQKKADMDLWDVVDWALVNVGVPACAATVLPVVLYITPARSLIKKVMWQSVSEGQLHWVAVAFSAAAISELSEYRTLTHPLFQREVGNSIVLLWLLILLSCISVIFNSVFGELVVRPGDNEGAEADATDKSDIPQGESKEKTGYIVASIVFTVLAGSCLTTVHYKTAEARRDVMLREGDAALAAQAACFQRGEASCEKRKVGSR